MVDNGDNNATDDGYCELPVSLKYFCCVSQEFETQTCCEQLCTGSRSHFNWPPFSSQSFRLHRTNYAKGPWTKCKFELGILKDGDNQNTFMVCPQTLKRRDAVNICALAASRIHPRDSIQVLWCFLRIGLNWQIGASSYLNGNMPHLVLCLLISKSKLS